MAEEENPQPDPTPPPPPPGEEPQAEAPVESPTEGEPEEAAAPPEGEPVAEADANDAAPDDAVDAPVEDEAVAAAGIDDGSPMDLPSFQPAELTAKEAKIAFLSDVNLKVKVELGRTRMYVEDVLRLTPGSVVELDKPAGDPVDIYVNERHVARGEVLVVNENFCVRVSEIIQQVPVDA